MDSTSDRYLEKHTLPDGYTFLEFATDPDPEHQAMIDSVREKILAQSSENSLDNGDILIITNEQAAKIKDEIVDADFQSLRMRNTWRGQVGHKVEFDSYVPKVDEAPRKPIEDYGDGLELKPPQRAERANTIRESLHPDLPKGAAGIHYSVRKSSFFYKFHIIAPKESTLQELIQKAEVIDGYADENEVAVA